MATAALPPFPTVSPNDACPAIVSPEDLDYLVEVLRLDGDKSESDLDNDVMAKAAELGIDITALPVAEQDPPTSRVSDSSASFPPCRRELTSSTSSQSSATSHSWDLDIVPTTTTLTKRPSDARRCSDTLSFSVYDKYISQLSPNISQPKFVKGVGAGEPGHVRFGFGTKRSLASFTNGFKTRKLWGKKPLSKSGAAT